jgi:hypothetical protein
MLSSSHLLCCEALPEERSAGNPHATFCGNRWQATATDDPVGSVRYPDRPYPDSDRGVCLEMWEEGAKPYLFAQPKLL